MYKPMSKQELWKLSATCYRENAFKTRLMQSATSRRLQVLERYEKNYTSQNRYNIFVKLIYAGLLIIVTVFPFLNIFQLLSNQITESNYHSLLLSSSLVFSFFCFVMFSCLMIINITNCAILFKGEIFNFLKQFSLSENDMKLLSFFVFIRMNYIQFIFMIFPLPIMFLFLTSSVWVFLILLVYNILNTAFVFLLFIYFSYIVTMKGFTGENSILGLAIQIMSILLYMVTVLPIFLFTSHLSDIFNIFYYSEILRVVSSEEFNILLSIIPVLSNAYFTTSLLLLLPEFSAETYSPLVLGSSMIGILLYMTVIYILYRKGKSIVLKETKMKKKVLNNVATEKGQIKIKRTKTLQTFIYNNLKMTARDFGSFVYIIIAVLLPFAYFYLLIDSYYRKEIPLTYGPVPLITLIIALLGIVLISVFLDTAFTSSDDTIESILSVIDYDVKDLYRARQILVIGISQIPILLIVLYCIVTNRLEKEILSIVYVLIILTIISAGLFLILKAYLFGRLNNRYMLIEINKENKILKTVGLMGIALLTLISFYYGIQHLTDEMKTDFLTIVIITTVIGVIFLCLIELLKNDLFSTTKNRMLGE